MCLTRKAFLLASAILTVLSGAWAQCNCGYRDPETLALFTDSIITYFNETDAAEQVVFTPERSADRYGRDDPGYAGTGQQAWINSERLNDWEDDFSATWRSAVMYDNTYLENNTMVMRVQAAEQKHRIVFGSQFQTRRRDILYGTFRTMVRPPSVTSAGTEFDIELAYNESSLMSTSLFSKDNASDAVLSLGWSSHKNNLKPVIINQTNISPDQHNHVWHEYRMDWLPTVMSWTNDGSNSTLTAVVRTNATSHDLEIPSIPAPFSYKHWANGSPTGSRGPPKSHSPLAEIRYARLFFNSSISARTSQFEQQCSAAGVGQVCSTEDWTLRNSTHFDLSMTEKQLMPKKHYHLRPYSWIGFTVSIGIFTLLFAHALVRRLIQTRYKKKVFYAEYDQKPCGVAMEKKPVETESEAQAIWAEMSDQKEFDKAMATWDNPNLLPKDDESDFEDEPELNEDDMSSDPFRFHDDVTVALSLGGSLHGYQVPSVQLRPHSMHHEFSYSPSVSSTANLAARIRSGITTPIGVSSADFSHSPSGRTMTPVISSPSYLRQSITPPLSQFADSLDEPSVVSGEDGLGAPPALPELAIFHPSPVMTLEDGRQMAVKWTTPVVEWNIAKADEQTDAHGQLAQRQTDGKPNAKVAAAVTEEFSAKETLWEQIKYRVFVHKEEVGATASGASRVEYLDGLRGFACLLVSVHHWCMIFYYGFTTPGVPIHYMFEHWIRRILGPIIANGGLNVGIFFVLAARVIANRYLVRGNLQDMAQQIFTRVPRLATTITAALFINYFLIEAVSLGSSSPYASTDQCCANLLCSSGYFLLGRSPSFPYFQRLVILPRLQLGRRVHRRLLGPVVHAAAFYYTSHPPLCYWYSLDGAGDHSIFMDGVSMCPHRPRNQKPQEAVCLLPHLFYY